jgi:hypothetical protein
MPIDERHADIARVALAAAGRKYQVALGGQNALRVHGVSDRVTHDIDLFVRRARHVTRASGVIADALEQAGYRVELVEVADSQGLWPDTGNEMREFEVFPPDDGDPVQVQIAYFAWTATVARDVGPVCTLDYLAARKVVALLERHKVRDYLDIAALTDAGYTLDDLARLAHEQDPGLKPEDFGEVGVHLDRNITDRHLARDMPAGKTPEWVRTAFATWPREPVYADDPLA